MPKKKSLVKNYMYHMLSQVLAVLVPLITTPYISRIMRPDGMGIYSYTYSISAYFCLFGRLGLDVYGQLRIAQAQDDREMRTTEFWGIFTAKTAVTAAAGLAYLILIVCSEKYRSMYLALTVCLFAQIFDISWLYQGVEAFRTIAVKNSLMKLLSVILIFAFVKERTQLVMYTVIVQGSVLAGNLSLWFHLSKTVGPPSLRALDIRRHIRGSLVYFIPAVATSVYTMLDKSMIGWMTQSEFENGYYEQAHKIEQILVTVLTSLSTVMLPRLKYMFSVGDREQVRSMIDTAMRFILMLSLPMLTGMLILAPDVIPWFLGAGYEECVGLLQIFSFLLVIVGLNNIVGKQCLMAADRQKYYNCGVILGALVNVALNFTLIPRYASVGAAVASVVSETVILIVFVIFGRDYLAVPGSYLRSFLKYLLSAAAMGGVVLTVKRFAGGGAFGLLAAVSAGIIAYGLILLILRDEFVKMLIKGRIKR